VYNYQVKKNWETGQQDTTAWWDKVCIWAIETYGLPGGNYITEIHEKYMIFKFKEKEQAMIMALRWGNDQ